MAQPRNYTRQFNFNDFQTTSPATPLPGTQVDAELNTVKLTLDDLNTNIAKIQQDDGKIKNQAVHKDSFDAGALALMKTGSYSIQGDWTASRTYAVGDLVDNNGATYVATSAHTSSSAFETDLTANKWILIANAGIANTASKVDKFEGTGSQTAFTLTASYTSNTDVMVFVNGALKNPGDDFSISTNTITFVTAPSTPAVSGNENVIVFGTSVVAQAAKESAETANTNAQGFANEADNWARKTNGLVESTDYSSKAYAIGGTGVDTGSGSAKDWATKTSGTVGNTGEYSAKFYATNANVATVATNIASVNVVAGIGSTALNAVAGKETEIGLLGQATPIANMAVLGTSTVVANIATCATDITNINNASANATKAENYAIKVDGAVESTNYSAKAWAIGGTGVTDTAGSGSAKDWATDTTNQVDGTEYSAKEYAIGSQTGQTNGSAKQWAIGGGNSFSTNTTVDGTNYSAKYWAEQAAASADSVDDIYLGSKSSNPSVDNDGNALQTGALYYNSSSTDLRVWNGSAWETAAVSTAGLPTAGFTIAMSIAL